MWLHFGFKMNHNISFVKVLEFLSLKLTLTETPFLILVIVVRRGTP